MIPGVCHIDIASSIDSDAGRPQELTVTGYPGLPLCEEVTGIIELLDAMVP
jgi:hypothetical protein